MACLGGSDKGVGTAVHDIDVFSPSSPWGDGFENGLEVFLRAPSTLVNAGRFSMRPSWVTCLTSIYDTEVAWLHPGNQLVDKGFCGHLGLVASHSSVSQDAADAISVRFNPLRAGFKRAEGDPAGVDTFCPDVLNTGVK